MIKINKDDITRIPPDSTPATQNTSISKNAMVSTAFPDATAAGMHVLRRGGNAVDAACAAALCLCVCEPQASGIFGQSVAIIHVNGHTVSVDGSGRAPALARPSLFGVPHSGEIGHMATTVPGTVSALGYMQKRYGNLEWPDVVAPAIRVAQKGYRITRLQHILQRRYAADLMQTGSGARYFLKDGTVPYDIGDLFVQEELADTLEYISADYRLFYTGVVADQIDTDMRNNGGLVRRTDLEKFGDPIVRDCIDTTYRGIRVSTVGAPGSGPTLLLSLNVLNTVPSKFLARRDEKSLPYMADAMRLSQEYHVQRPNHTDLYRGDTSDMYFGPGATRVILGLMSQDICGKANLNVRPNSEDTTHLSVIDGEGNAVGITQSIETVYGSRTAAENMGFLYNSYISTYEMNDASHPFYLKPGNIPWSSVCPSILFRDESPWMVVGSPGSSRIFSTVCQFISGMLDGGLPMNQAMEQARFYCSPAGKLHLERDDRLCSVMEPYADKRKYEIVMRNRYSFYMGAIHAVASYDEHFEGIAEVRRDGNAGGP